MFRMGGFARGTFRPLPLASRRLGQEGIDPLTPADYDPYADSSIPGLYTSIDQMPTVTEATPNLFASLEQDTRPTESVPGIVTKLPDEQPAGTSDSAWAKLLAQGLKSAGEGYGAYTKAEIAKMNAQAIELKAKNPAAGALIPNSLLSSSSNTPYIVMGALVVGLLGVLYAVS